MPVTDPFADSSNIFYYHRKMIAEHGRESSYALGWRDVESQQVRFKVLAGIGDMNGRTVLDAGCGYGDLYTYLKEIYPELVHYHGVEQIPELYNEALKRLTDKPEITLNSGNFIERALPKADYVLASGSLNYGSQDPQFIFKAITKLFGDATIGLAFNFLREIPSKGILTAYEPDAILQHCRTLTDNIVMIDHYAEEDTTIYLYH